MRVLFRYKCQTQIFALSKTSFSCDMHFLLRTVGDTLHTVMILKLIFVTS